VSALTRVFGVRWVDYPLPPFSPPPLLPSGSQKREVRREVVHPYRPERFFGAHGELDGLSPSLFFFPPAIEYCDQFPL